MRDIRRASAFGRSEPAYQETKGLGGATSGGARMLACSTDGRARTADVVSTAPTCAVVSATVGEAAKQPVRHFAWSMPAPQQSSAGIDMPMLSQGLSPVCANALAAGPKASQQASSATRSRREVMSGARLPARRYVGQSAALTPRNAYAAGAHLAQRRASNTCHTLAATKPSKASSRRKLERAT